MPLSSLQELERDPSFARFGYEHQMQLRSQWALQALGEDPEYGRMKPAQKQLVLDSIIYRPPVLEFDKEFEAGVANIGAHFNDSAEARKAALTYSAMSSLTNQMSIMKAGFWLAGQLGGKSARDMYSSNFGRDATKVKQYYDMLLSQDKRTVSSAKVLGIAAGLVGMGADMALWYGGLAGSVQKPKALVKLARTTIDRRFAVVAGKNARLANWFKVSAGPKMAHAVLGGGLVGAIREPLMKILEDSQNKLGFQDLLLKSAEGFGSYALGDLLFFALGGTLKSGFSTVKKVFMKGKPGYFLTGTDVSWTELQDMMRKVASGEAIDEARLARIAEGNPATHKAIRHAQDMFITARHLDKATDNELIALALSHKGWIAQKVKGEPGWQLSRFMSDEIGLHYDTNDAFKRRAAIELLKPSDVIEDVYRADQVGLRQSFLGALEKIQPGKRILKENVLMYQFGFYSDPKRKVSVKNIKGMSDSVKQIVTYIQDHKTRAFVPASLTGSIPAAGTDSIARGYHEALMHDPKFKLVKALEYDDFLKATEYLVDRGAINRVGTPLATINADQAWWNWVKDGKLIGQARGYLVPDGVNGLWDEAMRDFQGAPASQRIPRSVKNVEDPMRFATEARETIPISVRWGVTPAEADHLVKKGTFVKGHVGVLSPGDEILISQGKMPTKYAGETFLEVSARGKPNAILQKPSNPIDAMDFGKLKPSDVSDVAAMVIAREKAISMGHDGIRDVKAARWTAFHPEQVKFVSDAINPKASVSKVTWKMLDAAEASRLGSMAGKYKVSLMIQGDLKLDPQTSALAIAQALVPRNGEISPQNLTGAVKMYLKAAGVDMSKVDVRPVGGIPRSWQDATGYRGITLGGKDPATGRTVIQVFTGVPRKIADAGQQMAFVGTFSHEIRHILQIADPDIMAKATQIVPKGIRRLAPLEQLSAILEERHGVGVEIDAQQFAIKKALEYRKLANFTPAWAEQAIAKQGGRLQKVAGGWVIHKGGEVSPILKFDEVIDDVLRSDMMVESIHAQLREKGLVLVEGKKGDGLWYKIKTASGAKKYVPAEGPELEPLLKKIGFQAKLSEYLGPELAVIDDATGEVTYKGFVALGDYHNTMRHLGSFEAKLSEAMKDKILKVLPDGTSVKFNTIRAKYRVEIPGIEFHKDFDNPKEAMAWITEGWDQTYNLKEIASKKGYHLTVTRGGWQLSTNSGSYFAKDLDELQTLFQKVPLPGWAPELAGDYRVREKFPHPAEGTFKPQFFEWIPEGEQVAPLLQISHWWRPADAYFVKSVEKGAPESGLKLFRLMETSRQLASGDMHVNNKVIMSLFVENGKEIPKERRRGIFYWLDALDNDKEKVVSQFKMSAHDVEIAKASKEMLDRLFVKFGVKDYMYVQNYVSHLRAMPKGELTTLFKGTMENALHQTTNHREVHEFFKHWRIEDLALFALDDDALSVMLKYSSVGHRALYLNPVLDQIDEFLKGAKADPNIAKSSFVWRLAQYKDQIMGIHTPNEEAIQRAMTQFGQKVGLKGELMRDLYQSWYSVGYLAMMGWRPYSAARNVLQVWTTLAARFGNSNVSRGSEWFLKHADDVHALLLQKGEIVENLPVFGSEMMDANNLMSKLTHKGLAWFKRADDISRGIAWGTAHVQWDDAMKNFQKSMASGVNPDEATRAFMDISGMNLIKPDIRAEVGALIRGGKWSSAFDAYAGEIVKSTMFAYQSGLNPSAYRGLVGKMFGMFGVYPAWYVENVRQGLKYGSPAQKLAFATRFMGNGLALYGAFASVGIKAKDFLPWVPAQFTGGPYYDVANKILKSFGDDYAARQSRAELKKEIPRTFIPGSMMFQNLMKARESAEAGDIWRTWLYLTSTPTMPEG